VSPNGISTITRLVLFLLIPLLLWGLIRRVRQRPQYTLRPIPAFDMLRGLLSRVAESGKIVHLSLGTSGLGDDQTAVVVAGLAVLRYLVEQGVSFGAVPTMTVADPTLMLIAQDILYRTHQKKGLAARYRATDVQMIAPDATAYAVGAQDIVNQERVAANVMVGHFGEEYLLLGEAGAQREIVQMAGSNTVNVQPFLLSTSKHVLLGEEVFAAGAYLTGQPEHIASLCVQDTLRVLIVLAIVIGVLAKTVLGS
jgi:hypothetical protein